jgi:hypothetical protein
MDISGQRTLLVCSVSSSEAARSSNLVWSRYESDGSFCGDQKGKLDRNPNLSSFGIEVWFSLSKSGIVG